ncbi:MAG: MFS transporter [Dehalococcoidia bacterium]|nr:MFS transporter [Dehalococcoidia bacterium]
MTQEADAVSGKSPIRFAALYYPAFRNFWLSNTLSNVGNHMESPIRAWLIWTISQSPLMLALSQVVHWLPFFVLSLYAGIAADRVERRLMLAATQAILLGTVLALALLFYTGWINVWWVLGLTLVHGIVESLGQPVRLTLVSDIVEKKHLMSAVALNSVAQQLAKFIGPSIGGLLVGVVGVGGALLVDALTFLPFIVVIITLALPPVLYRARAETLRRNLAESFSYMRRNPALLSLVLVIAIPSIFGNQTGMLMTVFADEVYHVGPVQFGFLLSATGLGSVVAGLTLSYLGDVKRKGIMVLIATLLSGLFMMLFGLSNWYVVSLVFLFGLGASQLLYNTLTNTVLQLASAEDMRGRVMGFFSWTTSGMIVIGSLEAGLLAQSAGAPLTIAISGVITMLAVPLALWLAPNVRRVN